jgi:hypothetical protein
VVNRKHGHSLAHAMAKPNPAVGLHSQKQTIKLFIVELLSQ